jgi:RNA polymerase sigma-70 factor (ECF subfamily)
MRRKMNDEIGLNESLSDIEAAKQEGTFEILFKRYSARLYRTATRHLGIDDAKDIVQELMIEAWNKRFTLRGNAEGSLKNYLFIRLKFMIIDHYSRKPEQVLWEEALPELMAMTENLVDEQVIVQELEQIITDTLQEMSPAERHVFSLRWKQQLSVTETAKVLQISPKSVMNRFNLALNIVRNNIKKYYHEEEVATKYQLVLLMIFLSTFQ